MDLNTAVVALKSLKTFIQNKRKKFSHCEKLGAEKSETSEYVMRRKNKLNVRLLPLDYEQALVFKLSPSEEF